MNMKRWSSLFLLAIICLVMLAVLSTPVAAHAYLSDSDPSNGEQLDSPPDTISLFYSGDGVVIADIEIVGPDGDNLVDEVTIDPDDSQIVHVSLGDSDGEGVYIVEWEVLAEDGHTTSGTFFFSVGEEAIDRATVVAALDDEEDESIPPMETAAKGLVLVSLVGLIGIPITLGFAILPAARQAGIAPGTIDRRSIPLLGICIAILAIGLFSLGLARIGSIEPAVIQEFLAQTLGQIWLLQLLLTIGLVAVLFLAWRTRLDHQSWLSLLVAGSTLIATGIGWTSHSATLIGRIEGFAVTFSHLLGAGLWIGGLLTLAIILPPLLGSISGQNATQFTTTTIRRYSVLALAGVTLALATGLILAAWHVPSLDAAISSVYGMALSVKTVAILFALGLGGLTRYILLSDLEPWRNGLPQRLSLHQWLPWRGTAPDASLTRIRRSIRTELAVVVVILLLAGVMTSVPTAAIVADSDQAGELTFDRSDDEIDVTITIFPAEEIGNWPQLDEGQPVVVDVEYTDDLEVLESDGAVRLLADHSATGTALEITLEHDEATGVYSGVLVLPDPGHWGLRITGSPAGSFSSEWIEVFARPDADGHDHGDEDTLTDGFSLPFLVGAILIGVIGVFTTTIEALRLRN